MGIYTSYLFARPSFIEGMARVIDIGGTMIDYNFSPNGEIADAMAFRADALALREDTREALRQLAGEIEAGTAANAR